MLSKVNFREALTIVLAFFSGTIVSFIATVALAQSNNPNFIHACVKTASGSIRIVSATETCLANETALEWSQNGIGTFGGFTTNQLIGYASAYESFDYRLFDGANFTNSNFSSFNFAFSSFVGSNFTDAKFYGGIIDNSNFANSQFVNIIMDGVGITNTNLTGVDFTGATLTNINWANTICPDGTNSDNNGNTCDGHLTP